MKPPDLDYVRPASVEEAVVALVSAGGEGKILAGGQSLVPLLNFRLASPRLLVDINRIPVLSGIEPSDGALRIGGLTRMRRLEMDPLVRSTIPLLSTAASWVGHVQIRNRGTLGGTLAHADPAAEIPAVCLLLDAEVKAVGPGGERSIAVADLFAGFLTTTLGEDEVLTEVRLPIPATDERWGFREFAHRRGDFALAGAATRIRLDPGGAIRDARIVVFGTADQPLRPAAAESALLGQQPSDEALSEAARIAAATTRAEDPRPDAGYREVLMRTLVQRALADAVGQQEVAR